MKDESTRRNAVEIAPVEPRCTWKALDVGVEINQAAWSQQARQFLKPEVVRIVARLHREFDGDRRRLLEARQDRQHRFDQGETPTYAHHTEQEPADWRVAPLPADLLSRRVEITGPVNDTKMVINMLSRNSEGQRADAAMLDFEDSMKPTWTNVMDGIANLIGAASGALTFEKRTPSGELVKRYALEPEDMPILMVRCRGLHLEESNLRVDDMPVAGGLLDLALSVFHTAETLVCKSKTPKYYVPKCEHFLEARWWNSLFARLEQAVDLPRGTLRTTFLIETLPAAFQMEEILFEIRERAAGLNVGRWDKIFSDIKVLREHPDRVMADRASISLNRPWMKGYAELLIRICHRRGAFAMGGMAAFTPGSTADRRIEQTQKVLEDKRFEFSLGHDGCWVSHPYFIGPALSAFTSTNQLERVPDIADRPDLLPQGSEPRTLEGLRTNVRVGIGYMQGWNQDIGCVAWDDLMEDLATLEISRAQVWQWLRHAVTLDDGTRVSRELVESIFDQELRTIISEVQAAFADRPDSEIIERISSFTRASQEAQDIFLERGFRPFLASRSELVQAR